MPLQAGRLNKWVTLARSPVMPDDADGYWEPLTPDGCWCAIEPTAPGVADDRSIHHLVTMRYHPEVTVDTRILYGDRRLFVQGIQNVNEAGAELRLYCIEVQP